MNVLAPDAKNMSSVKVSGSAIGSLPLLGALIPNWKVAIRPRSVSPLTV